MILISLPELLDLGSFLREHGGIGIRVGQIQYITLTLHVCTYIIFT